jgi:hypothetical protein
MAQVQLQSVYPHSGYYYSQEFDDAMDSNSPISIEDPELVPILDREDNSDLSRPDSSISSYSSRSSTDSLCAFDTEEPSPFMHIPQKYQFPRAPPPTPFMRSPCVSPMRNGLEDGKDLYIAPFVLSSGLLELHETLENVYVGDDDEELTDMKESEYIPFSRKSKVRWSSRF